MVTPFYNLGNIETDITIYPKAMVINCSMVCKQLLALWGGGGTTMTNPDSVLENRDITLSKVCIVKAMIFPVVMYRCESWTIKKAEC